MKDIAILGAGGLAREVAFLVEEINRDAPVWRILGFVEAEQNRVGTAVGEYKITLSDAELEQMHLSVAIGIGTPAVVARVTRRLTRHKDLYFPNLMHPGTIWDETRVALGQGNVICAGNLLTTDIRFGSYNFVNLGCTIGHDVVVGDCCVVSPRACISGGVKIGNECLIGAGRPSCSTSQSETARSSVPVR